MRNIDDIYISIWCIYHLLIELSKCGSNNQRSMLSFHKENTVSRKNKCQGRFPTLMLALLVNLYSFGARCIYGLYSRHGMSALQYYIHQRHDENKQHLC